MVLRRDFHKLIIGRSERIFFVETNISNVPAKIDTGAYRSAIHAGNIREQDGILHFELLANHPVCGSMSQTMKTSEFRLVQVANSFGHEEMRYEVKLKVKIGPKVFQARFTLADRSKKVYPILLGRMLLNGRFLIDTDESAVDRVQLKKEYGIEFPNDEEGGREL